MKTLKRIFMYVLIVLAVISLAVYIFLQQAQFGKLPSGARLERIKNSPNYKDGQFQNQSPTPSLTEGASYTGVMWEFMFGKSDRTTPKDSLPSIKTDLKSLPADSNVLIWMGHSAYYIQVDGKKILVDPVLSGSASPLAMGTKSFRGADIYTTAEIPVIDYLFISHDHWDHLDYKTMLELKDKVGKVITGLGTGAHFEHWGFDSSKVIELDWQDEALLDSGFSVHALPARHFAGRALSRNKALWVSFAFKTPTQNIYIGGDSGYDKHFAKIGEQFGPFDLAILECGQYDKSWKYIHMLPEEIGIAARDLKAKKLFPVHWGKFVLGNHAWDASIIELRKANSSPEIPILTPMIGEPMYWQQDVVYSNWWEKIK